MQMSSTEVGSTSFEALVTLGIVSSGFPANINAACDFPVSPWVFVVWGIS